MNEAAKITLKTERLELVPLLPYQLRLWVEDIPNLEKDLKCSYQAEPMEGPFLEIVKGQLEKQKSILMITYGIAFGFWFTKVTGLLLTPLISGMFRIRIKRSKLAMGWEKSLSTMDT